MFVRYLPLADCGSHSNKVITNGKRVNTHQVDTQLLTFLAIHQSFTKQQK